MVNGVVGHLGPHVQTVSGIGEDHVIIHPLPMEELNVQDQVFKEQHAAPEVSLKKKIQLLFFINEVDDVANMKNRTLLIVQCLTFLNGILFF